MKFNPKITHRLAGVYIDRNIFKSKPWEYLEDWQKSDRGYDPDELATINAEMQERYPGPYKVVKTFSPYQRFYYFEMEFNTPAEETLFRLKWS